MLKKVGSWIGSAKRYVSNIQNQVTDITDENLDQDNDKTIDKNKDLDIKNDR